MKTGEIAPATDYAERQKAETLAQHRARVEQRTPIKGRVSDPINMVGGVALIEEVDMSHLYVETETTTTNEEEVWKKIAKCSDIPDVNFFFPLSYREGIRAKEFCIGCPVKKECLEYAITMGLDSGVWGGASERERRKMRRESKMSQKKAQ